jgi:hypothetical protein
VNRPFCAVGVLVALAAFGPAGVASAQQAPTLRRGELSLVGGMTLAAGHAVGDVTATLRRNTTGSPPPFTLLRAESDLNRAIGVEGRLSIGLSPRVALEAGASYARRALSVSISEDPEAPRQPSITENVDQYLVDVSALYQVPMSLGRRGRPYTMAGAGYLRQLHEGRVLVENGYTIHAGGGIQYWWRGTSAQRRLGLRGEARYVWRRGGVEFEDRARRFASVSLLAFIGL